MRRRLHVQRVAADPFEHPADAVAWLGAVQAQEYDEAKWSLGLRTRGWDDARIEQAFGRGELLRTHVLRPTWHFVTPADIGWLLRLTAPRVQAGNARWYGELGLDGPLLARAHDVIAGELAGGRFRTRKELGAALGEAGIHAEGQRLAYVMMHAELEGLVCSGPRRGKQHTYALLAERAPADSGFDRDEALAELALRYFRSHGPASVTDFCAWSSLRTADARAGVEAAGGQLASDVAADGTSWISDGARGPAADGAGAFLIPAFDETLTYRTLKTVPPLPLGRGNQRPPRPVLIDGATVGSWKRSLRARSVHVEVAPLGPLGAPALRRVEEAVQRFGRFLGHEAELSIDA